MKKHTKLTALVATRECVAANAPPFVALLPPHRSRPKIARVSAQRTRAAFVERRVAAVATGAVRTQSGGMCDWCATATRSALCRYYGFSGFAILDRFSKFQRWCTEEANI